jgi:hypothetical protein
MRSCVIAARVNRKAELKKPASLAAAAFAFFYLGHGLL